MRIAREWATPLTIGSFAAIAVTGVLMFFHVDSGLNKAVHEWVSWLLVIGVALHVLANVASFKRYFTQARARWLIGGGLLVLALSFAPLGGRSEPPFVGPLKVLAAAPLPTLAQLAGVSTAQMRDRLRAAGLAPAGDADSVQSLAGPDLRRQVGVLRRVLVPGPAPTAGG